MRAIVAVLASALVTACGSSPPTRFYALQPSSATTRLWSPSGAPIKVDAVHIPPVLDRRTMVRGQNNYQLNISSQDRWGSDFGEMIRRVLTQDLQDRLAAGSVVSPNSPAPQDARGIVVDILSFEPNGAGAVTLDAEWTLLQGSPAQPAVQRTVHLSATAADSAAGQAAAMSRLIGRLADEIVQAMAAKSQR